MKVLPQPEVVVDGLTLPECPRWHAGALWFSDVKAGRVYRLGADDAAELVGEFSGEFAGGLGFLPNGDLLTVMVHGRTLQRTRDGRSAPYADLVPLTRFGLNDMIVDREGRAYVGQPGFDIWGAGLNGMPDPTDILLVRPDGSAEIAASGLAGPNGMAITPDGRTLYVAEPAAMLVSAYAIGADGGLSDRRVFAQLPGGAIPDGICLDDAGAVWAAAPVSLQAPDGRGPGVLRLVEGGEATHLVPVGEGRRALACVFGGADRSELYVCTVAEIHGETAFAPGAGRLERVRLGHRGAGLP